VVARLLVALIVVLPYAFPSVAPAASKPSPKELWEKFPLEPTPSPTRLVAAPRDRVRVVRADDGIGPIALISLILLAAGAGAATVAVTRRRQAGPAPTAAPLAAPKPAPPPRVRVGPPLLAPTPRAAAPRRPPVPAPRAKRAARPPRGWAMRSITASNPTLAEAADGWETCRIKLWEGYVTKRFYAAAPGRREWIAHSSCFNVERGLRLEESPAAERALAEVLDGLAAAGWEVVGRGAAKFDVTLRRNAGAAPQEPVV
jgi:hypothetical protein